jgi:hypothetical protein
VLSRRAILRMASPISGAPETTSTLSPSTMTVIACHRQALNVWDGPVRVAHWHYCRKDRWPMAEHRHYKREWTEALCDRDSVPDL